MRHNIDTSGMDLNNAKAEREFRMNPPKNEPGQGTLEGWNMEGNGDGSTIPGSSLGGNNQFNGPGMGGDEWSGGNNGVDPMSLVNGGNPSGVVQQGNGGQPNPMQGASMNGGNGVFTKDEEAFMSFIKGVIRVIGGLCKAISLGFKVFYEEFKEANNDNYIIDRFSFGSLSMRISLCGFAVGLLLRFMAIPVKNINTDCCMSIMIGSLMSLMVGIMFASTYYGPQKEERRKRREKEAEQPLDDYEEDGIEEDSESDINTNGFDDMFGDDSNTESEGADFGDDGFGDDEDENMFDNWDIPEDEEEEKVEGGVYQEDINVGEMLNDLKDKEVPAGMYTRSYLVETFTKVLPLMNPNFASMKEIPDSSDDFIGYEDILREAAQTAGVKDEDDLPILISLRENMFLVQLKTERTKSCIGKEQTIADELVSIYKCDDYGQPVKGREDAYALVNTVGTNLYINLFVGGSPMISLGDIYNHEKDFIMNPKITMPYIWGTDEFGHVLKCDAYKTNSYIISGKPRGGKSWKVQSLVLQLCMFSSPEEINFYVFDPKGTDSDYYKMSRLLPHFKRFESKPDKILQVLRQLTDDSKHRDGTVGEAERRRIFINSYDSINIIDMKENHPEAKLPFIYVIIDEMKSLTGSFDKDDKAEFQTLLGKIVTQLPNRGYRVILIPHRITNEIISKQIYPLVGCRTSVRGDFEEIKTGLEITRKDFPYNLPKEGDMALRSSNINNNKATFCHGEVITTKNETNTDVFRYVGEVWKRLCPGCDKDMVGANDRYVPAKERKIIDRADDSLATYEDTVDNDDSLSIDDLFDDEPRSPLSKW